MLLLIILFVAVLYPIGTLKIDPPFAVVEPQIPADISIKHIPKNDEQPVATEGQFIVAEGNSDHLFRPYDFIKEDAIQLGEDDTSDTKGADKVRHSRNSINPSLPPVQLIEGDFIHYEKGSDEHLFAKEDFEKHDFIAD